MTNGHVVTFYSYKGGVGRSFALANVAALLARWGWRVLCIDWDLEAPGLSYYLRTHSPSDQQEGLLEMVEAVARKEKPDATGNITRVDLDENVTLDLLPVGRSASYAWRIQALNWEQIYAESNLGMVLEHWRAEWVQTYDIILVDSRTGITDIGGICTAQLPDILVLVFSANQQSIDGVLRVLDDARAARNRLPFDRPQLLTVPVPSRFDVGVEYERAEQWRRIFECRFADCYRDWAARGLPLDVLIGHTTIPYSAYWSLGEDLPVLSENVREPSYISYQLATLAALLIHRLDNTELLVTSRDSYVDDAIRRGRRRGGFKHDISVSCTLETRPQASQLAQVLRKTGQSVLLISDEQRLGEPIERQLDDSQHLVLVIGERPSKLQKRGARYFLRQALDEDSERRLVSIVTSGAAFEHMPGFLGSFATIYDLSKGTVEDAAVKITERPPAPSPAREAAREAVPPAPSPAREAVLHELYELYERALAELRADRPAGISLLDSLLIEDPGYRDAAARRDAARQKYRLTTGDQSAKLNRLQLVVFDLNDGLVGTESLLYQATRDLIFEYSDPHRPILLDSYGPYVGMDEVKFFSEMVHRYQIRGKTPVELVAEREKRYWTFLQNADPGSLLKPRFSSTLELLARRDVKIGICSNSSKERVQVTLDRLGIANYLSACVTPGQGVAAKPSPEMYLSLLREVDVQPRDCLVVESSLLGLSASVAAGCFTLLLYGDFTAPMKFPRPGVEPIENSQHLADWFEDFFKVSHGHLTGPRQLSQGL